jgi:ABC-type glutathione transport system ATPase component
MLLDAVPRLGDADNACPANGHAASPAPLLDVSGLTVRFPVRSGILNRTTARVHAVENVSFAIEPGETLAFVGESGCGKTTIGRSILGLAPIEAGTIRFEGEDITRLTGAALREKRRHMQVIFQDPFASLDPRQSIGAAIAEPIRVHGLADRRGAAEKTGALLRKVGLDPAHAVRLPHEFSGGQRQRICIARALALEPRLIVADESVSALDVSIRARILELMQQLQDELGLSYLFISHDIAVVERIAHRTAVLYLGEIVEIGPTRDVLGNPQHAYTRRLLEAVPRPDPARRRTAPIFRTDEVPSPLRPVRYEPPRRTFREAGPGHFVQAG